MGVLFFLKREKKEIQRNLKEMRKEKKEIFFLFFVLYRDTFIESMGEIIIVFLRYIREFSIFYFTTFFFFLEISSFSVCARILRSGSEFVLNSGLPRLSTASQ